MKYTRKIFKRWRQRKVNQQKLDRAIRKGKDLSQLDVSEIEDFSYLFAGCSQVGDISTWDTRSARNMEGMFYECKSFNQPVEHLNTSQVTNMGHMFYNCMDFNQPVEGLGTHQVATMESMFQGCKSFNQPIEGLATSNVINMANMLYDCRSFNQPIEKLRIGSVRTFYATFRDCKAFNQPIERINLSNAGEIIWMFCGCTSFNQPIQKLRVRNQDSIPGMFEGCTSFQYGYLPHMKPKPRISVSRTVANIKLAQITPSDYIEDTFVHVAIKEHILENVMFILDQTESMFDYWMYARTPDVPTEELFTLAPSQTPYGYEQYGEALLEAKDAKLIIIVGDKIAYPAVFTKRRKIPFNQFLTEIPAEIYFIAPDETTWHRLQHFWDPLLDNNFIYCSPLDLEKTLQDILDRFHGLEPRYNKPLRRGASLLDNDIDAAHKLILSE